MLAVITVTGKDMVGVLAKVSGECADAGANIIDVSQTVMQGLFAMIMMVDIDGLNCDFTEMVDRMEKLGQSMGYVIHVMHEDIFNAMHRI